MNVGDAATLASSLFSLAGIATSKVKFWIYRDNTAYYPPSTNDDRVLVYVNTAASLSGATLLGTVNRLPSLPPATVGNGWYEYTVDIPGTFNGTANYLLMKGVSGYGNDIHLDDISVVGITSAVPGSPTGVAAIPENAQASVSFSAPFSDGSSPILDYTVTSNPGGHTVTGAASPLTVTSLTNGTPYSFTVTARNSTGSSAPSAASVPVTPRTVPDAPVIGTATAGNVSATVSFGPPASDGGSAILDYTATASPGGQTATGTTSPLTVTGLNNGTAYTFTVTARNNAGTGASSAASSSVTPYLYIKIGSSGYPSITAAYTDINSGELLQLRDLTFIEAVRFNSAKTFSLKGGYDLDFTTNHAVSTINGSLIITDGSVTVENIAIR